MLKVHVIDYGAGNLLSVERAVTKVGGEVIRVQHPEQLANADRVILPGVGAFRDGMEGLRNANLDEPLRDFVRTGRPLLGICLGMQMLVDSSSEFGSHPGLGLIPGHTVAIPDTLDDGGLRKVPFIGWAELQPPAGTDFAASPLAGTRPGEAVYLVHSYHVEPDTPANLVATYAYRGCTVTAAIARDNIVGYQFHPEKSGATGLRILKAFLDR